MNSKPEITAEEIVERLTQEVPQVVKVSYDNYTVKGKLDLSHRIIHVAVTLTNCTFTDEVNLRYCEFKQYVDFSKSHFEKDLDSGQAIYRKGLNLIEAAFEGGANFNTLQCEGIGFLKKAQFRNEEKEINFVNAKFGRLECNGATFKGNANFNTIKCEGGGFFRDTQFENEKKEINFSSARFGTMECHRAIFKGGASFNGLQCEEGGFFKDAQFKKAKKGVDFSYTRFGVSLEFQRTTFVGKVDLTSAEVTGTAILCEATFQNSVTLNCATINNLSMADLKSGYRAGSLPFKKKDVDLRRCKFSIFEGTKEQQRHLVEHQSPEKFSMDPYLQFEKYYRSIGDEDYAKEVYRKGRRSVRKNAVGWSWTRKVKDWFLCWTVGYGVRMRRLFIWILPLLIAGTVIFWSDKALVAKQNSAAKPKESIAQKTNPIGGTQKQDRAAMIFGHAKHLFHRMWYSVDLFIPIVNLRIADEYKRPHGWRAFYTVFHIGMGWLLVPLLIASLSGVIKK